MSHSPRRRHFFVRGKWYLLEWQMSAGLWREYTFSIGKKKHTIMYSQRRKYFDQGTGEDLELMLHVFFTIGGAH